MAHPPRNGLLRDRDTIGKFVALACRRVSEMGAENIKRFWAIQRT
jgi:hypothetical protein